MKYNYKVGDKAIVINNICGHRFQIGDIVEIIEIAEHQDYFLACDGEDFWYVSKDELIPYEIVKPKILEEFKYARR
jgi:hypothetical protein